jgi:hypothetical protein
VGLKGGEPITVQVEDEEKRPITIRIAVMLMAE